MLQVLRSVRIRTKLALAFSAGVAVVLMVSALGLFQLHRLNAVAENVATHRLPATRALGRIETDTTHFRQVQATVLLNEGTAKEEAIARLGALAQRIEDGVRAYEPLVEGGEPRRLFDAARQRWAAYLALNTRLIALSRQDAPAAIALYRDDVRLAFNATQEPLDAAIRLNMEEADAVVRHGQAAYREAFWEILGVAAVATILTAIVALFIRHEVGGGIHGLAASLLRLSRRDYGFELPEASRGDEIGEMARAVATCRDGLREADALAAAQAEEAAAKVARGERVDGLLRGFEAEAAEVLRGVASAAVELNATAGEMAGTAQDGVARATSVAAASEQASANVQTVAASAEELAASIAEVARQVGSSAEVARRAAEDARATDGAVQGLSEAARSIGDVVRLINDIAGQTNLLALNATIEAARAGEAGRGFAVVASEVKTLAAQTAKATEQIGAQISAMQGETARAVQAIGGIVRTIEEMNSITAQVAAAAEEQTAATREIGRAVSEAASGTQEVSRHTAGVTEGAERTGAAADQLRAASSELAQQSEQLRGRVDRFLSEIRAA
jgi:methyl-accepting chemotaxis protein